MPAARYSTSKSAAAILVLALFATFIPALPAHADSIRDREYWLAEYGISTAWNTTKGKGVTIAVIDTGVDGSHQDLLGVVSGGADFSGVGAANGQKPIGDGKRHATMVASLAAGRGHAGGAGVLGAAPEASILSISIGFGSGEDDSDDQIAEAIVWAVDNGADVINMSLTRNTLDWPESWDDAFLYAMDHDVVLIAAAGNRGAGTTVIGAPATMPGVLTVAGLDRGGSASWDASSQGITIGVSAPSESLVGAVPGNGYVSWEGTSGAAPIVAGVAALVIAAHPELDAANVINRIVATAKPAGAPGVDPIYGYGRLDAAAAVNANVASVTENPMGSLEDWITLHRRAELTPTPAQSGPAEPMPETTPIAGANESRESPLSASRLQEVGIPLALFLGFVAALVLLVLSARRYFARHRNGASENNG